MNHSARWVLPGGARIGIFMNDSTVYSDKVMWGVDPQPNNGTEDTFILQCSTSSTNIVGWNYPILKPGECLQNPGFSTFDINNGL